MKKSEQNEQHPAGITGGVLFCEQPCEQPKEVLNGSEWTTLKKIGLGPVKTIFAFSEILKKHVYDAGDQWFKPLSVHQKSQPARLAFFISVFRPYSFCKQRVSNRIF